MEMSPAALCQTRWWSWITWPCPWLTTNGAVATNSSPLPFWSEWKPTQPQFGPQPPSTVVNTGSSPRRNRNDSELSGDTKALQSEFVSAPSRGEWRRWVTKATKGMAREEDGNFMLGRSIRSYKANRSAMGSAAMLMQTEYRRLPAPWQARSVWPARLGRSFDVFRANPVVHFLEAERVGCASDWGAFSAAPRIQRGFPLTPAWASAI